MTPLLQLLLAHYVDTELLDAATKRNAKFTEIMEFIFEMPDKERPQLPASSCAKDSSSTRCRNCLVRNADRRNVLGLKDGKSQPNSGCLARANTGWKHGQKLDLYELPINYFQSKLESCLESFIRVRSSAVANLIVGELSFIALEMGDEDMGDEAMGVEEAPVSSVYRKRIIVTVHTFFFII